MRGWATCDSGCPISFILKPLNYLEFRIVGATPHPEALRNDEQMSTINIAIADGNVAGPQVTTWEIWETEASRDYDGFGTFTIMELGGVRTVLIRSEHWDWQTSRYASGFCMSRKSDLDPETVAEFLWKRLMGKTEQP